MLQNLHVKNLALIDEAEVDFSGGLNILTGETGAGKSIILGSVSLALGGRYSADMLRKGADKGLVELTFYVENPETVRKLEEMDLSPDGGQIIITRRFNGNRSVSRINGETVTLGRLKEAAQVLIDIHGQHEHQSLLYKKNHLAILDAFAKGDYTVKSGCRDAYVGEFDTVHAKLIATTEHVSDALKSIRESSNQVAQGSDQLAVSAQDLAKNATDQAVAVDSLAQSVSEITEQILGTSKSIDIVHDKAKDVGTTAAVSQQKMTELTEAMERISVTSKEIGQVIEEIESIASQTNLLSLNASIEAARAGEAGKGFAVVAEQIRMLAESSANSADTSKQLLTENQNEVEHGNQVTQQTAESLTDVLNELDAIVGEVATIRTASDREAAFVKEIEDSTKQISDAIQSNSAASEETSATSEELSAEADSLEGLVERFKLR